MLKQLTAASDLSFPPLLPKRLPLLCIPCRTVTRAIHPALGSGGPKRAVVTASSGYVPACLCFDDAVVNAPPYLQLASIHLDLLLV